MPNPKDWFRRHRPIAPASGSQGSKAASAGDELRGPGEGATPWRELPRLSETRLVVAPDKAGPVPPPPARPTMAQRAAAGLDRSAFRVRPEIVQPRALQAPHGPGNGSLSAFAFRRGTHPQPTPARPEAIATGRSIQASQMSEAKPVPEAKLQPHAEVKPHAAVNPAAASGESLEHAAFTIGAPGLGWSRARPQTSETAQVSARLRDAFTPTRPKQSASLFSGRFKQLQRVIAAIEEERAHVVLYGERGSGKTSLANVLAAKAEDAGYIVRRFACNSELGFEEIFRGVLRRLPATLLPDGIGATSRAGVENLEQLLPQHCGVAELVAALERVSEKHVILIIDEYDRITAEDTKAKFAELIKNLSDSAVPVTLLIIGVADNVRELLGKHPSLQRTLVTVPMPLMSRREIEGIITAGEEKSGLRFDPAVRQTIADFAQGLPYHAQLLCLFAARNAARRRSIRVEREDLRHAVQRAAEEAEPRTREAYDLAVGHHENASFRDVLFYAARCRTDEFGTFTAADVAVAAGRPLEDGALAAGSSLLALQYPLKKLTEPERGAVLRRIVGPGGLRYQFSTQMMRHHVLARQAEQRHLV
jgi:Cdc6-like AAA superfamily ATPase